MGCLSFSGNLKALNCELRSTQSRFTFVLLVVLSSLMHLHQLVHEHLDYFLVWTRTYLF